MIFACTSLYHGQALSVGGGQSHCFPSFQYLDHEKQCAPSSKESTLVDYSVFQATGSPSTSDDNLQFNIVLRRQRMRTSGAPKFKAAPSRFLNLSDDFEFAGWGSIFRIALSRDDLSHGHDALVELRSQRVLGQFAGSALAANDILGGVFYTVPTVFAVSGV